MIPVTIFRLFFEAYDGMTVPKNLTEQCKLDEIVDTFIYARSQILRSYYFGNGKFRQQVVIFCQKLFANNIQKD